MELQFPLIFTLLLILFIVFKRHASKTQKTHSKLPPGPLKLPLIGHLHHLLGLPHQKLRDLAKNHGPIMSLQLGELYTIIISSSRLAKEIMMTHDLVFADRGEIEVGKIMSYDYKGIVFTPYGGYWRQLKKICVLELLSVKRVQSFWSLREEAVTKLVDEISCMAGLSINLSQKIAALTNDITSKTAFGKEFKGKETFLSLMPELMELADGFNFADVFPSLKFLQRFSAATSKLEKLHQKMDGFLANILNEHRVNKTRTKASKVRKDEDLVDVLLKYQENGELEFPIEDDNIKAIIWDLLVAGSETSSTTIEWALSELMRNPIIMEKVQSEVRHVLNGKRTFSQSDLDELKYLRFVIKETLRLHPVIALLIPRESRERCEIDGYVIPKGTKLFVNVWAIGRDPDNWSDAEIFKPERFQDLSIDYKGSNFEYIPFGAGRRMCPGISFGIANVELPLAQLLYYFDWKLPNGANPQELDMTERSGAAVGRKSNLYLVPTPYHF